jgi:hypothetical protein
MYLPAGHDVQTEEEIRLYLPALQLVHAEAPPTE